VAALFLAAAWQTTRATALLERALARVTAAAGLTPVEGRGQSGTRFRLRPATLPQAAQAGLVVVILASTAVGGVSIVEDVLARRALAEAARANEEQARANAPLTSSGGIIVDPTGDVLVADGRAGLIRRFRPTLLADALPAIDRAASTSRVIGEPVPFEGATDLVLAVDGDFLVADARNNRICRIDRPSGRTITVAGSGEEGYDGDAKQAAQAALHGPEGLAVARNGDIYIADTLNNRVRVVIQATGVIKTVAGGVATDTSAPAALGGVTTAVSAPLGDGGPATAAQLLRPSGVALAPNGDLYIADTGHHRIRKVSAATGLISTIAGDGTPGWSGDGGPARLARLAAPLGLAVVGSSRGVTVYVADSLNGRVRRIDTEGTIVTLGGIQRFVLPSRLSYHSAGRLYVKDASATGVTAVPVPKSPGLRFAVQPPAPRKVT
jgi:sugar lactone lactonase YvrE